MAEITVEITQRRDLATIKRDRSIDANYELSIEEFQELYGNMKFRDGDYGIWCTNFKIGMGPSVQDAFEDAKELKAAISEAPDDFMVCWFDPQWEGHTEEVIRLVYLG